MTGNVTTKETCQAKLGVVAVYLSTLSISNFQYIVIKISLYNCTVFTNIC